MVFNLTLKKYLTLLKLLKFFISELLCVEIKLLFDFLLHTFIFLRDL